MLAKVAMETAIDTVIVEQPTLKWNETVVRSTARTAAQTAVKELLSQIALAKLPPK